MKLPLSQFRWWHPMRKCWVYNYNFMPRGVFRDNKHTYNTGSGPSGNFIRVPSLKRNKKVWKNFYKLFPRLRGQDTYNGIKLKKV